MTWRRPGARQWRASRIQEADSMTTLDDWTATACADLGIDPAAVDVRQILDLARDAAHQVDRPAAPVTAYLLGLAVGAGMRPDQAAARLRALVAGWQPPST
jgi:uncharacterized protein DUF6457